MQQVARGVMIPDSIIISRRDDSPSPPVIKGLGKVVIVEGGGGLWW